MYVKGKEWMIEMQVLKRLSTTVDASGICIYEVIV
jgi:hypothetical protein